MMGFFSRFLEKDTDDEEPERRPTTRQYAGVEVIPDSKSACEAVQRIAGKRFLTADAPRLPLQDCDQPACGCRYCHYKDRRTDARRDADIGIGTRNTLQTDERRAKRGGRRKTDLDE